jgi:hypothetical protein
MSGDTVVWEASRAAGERGQSLSSEPRVEARGRAAELCFFWTWNCWPGLATTRSPTVRTAVPWARRGFTAEFGMGSGGTPAQ